MFYQHCVYVYHDHALCQQILEEGVKHPGPGATDNCKAPCGCWELNPSPGEEQPVLTTPEPSFQPISVILLAFSLPESCFPSQTSFPLNHKVAARSDRY